MSVNNDIPIGLYHNPVIHDLRRREINKIATDLVDSLLNATGFASPVHQNPIHQSTVMMPSSDIPIGLYHNPVTHELRKGAIAQRIRDLTEYDPAVSRRAQGGLFFGNGLPADGKFIPGTGGEVAKKLVDEVFGEYAPGNEVSSEGVLDRLVRQYGLIGFISDDPDTNAIIMVSREQYVNLKPAQVNQITRFFKPDENTVFYWTKSLEADPVRVDPELSMGMRFTKTKPERKFRSQLRRY